MDRIARKEFIHYYAPGRKLFQIVVKIGDEPGSLSRVLNLLGSRVNLVGITSFGLRDGTAIVSGFSEALSKEETPEKLKSLILTSSAARDAEVMEGSAGILVDTFHNGLEADGESLMLFRRDALAGMFDRVYQLLGSGGETLLFEQGAAIGRANGEAFVKMMGPESVRENLAYLRNNLAALGWGRVSMAAPAESGLPHLLIHDCFECTTNAKSRTGCHFFRGYIVGNRSATLGQDLAADEVRCRLRGADACEFALSPRHS